MTSYTDCNPVFFTISHDSLTYSGGGPARTRKVKIRWAPLWSGIAYAAPNACAALTPHMSSLCVALALGGIAASAVGSTR